MKQLLICNLLLFSISSALGQTVERILLNGVISAEGTDIEGVVIYNTSSNSGTVTNQKGAFTIAVTVNDVVEVSALQFEMVSIIITKEIIASKLLKIYLSEQINQLDTILLSSGLSGLLALDVEKAKERPKITMELGNLDNLEFFNERAFDNQVVKDALSTLVNKGGLYNGINFIGIGSMLFKSKSRKPSNNIPLSQEKQKTLTEIFSNKYITETFNIPEENVEAFRAFVEANGLNPDYLKKENELLLIEFLVKQSELFLNSQHAKN
ncbi:hypothetical protein [Mariniflexile sp.]|uniref:hypothetical protein n=1 Tax=Mariniflexile sp. TaxID=1979402 RepID=UPI0040475C7E